MSEREAHEAFSDRLLLVVEQVGSEAERAEILQHVAGCAACQSELDALRRVTGDLRSALWHPAVEDLVLWSEEHPLLPADRAAALEQHLSTCATCREHETLLRAEALPRSETVEEEGAMPAALRARLLAAGLKASEGPLLRPVARPATRRRTVQTFAWVGTLAACLVLLVHVPSTVVNNRPAPASTTVATAPSPALPDERLRHEAPVEASPTTVLKQTERSEKTKVQARTAAPPPPPQHPHPAAPALAKALPLAQPPAPAPRPKELEAHRHEAPMPTGREAPPPPPRDEFKPREEVDRQDTSAKKASDEAGQGRLEPPGTAQDGQRSLSRGIEPLAHISTFGGITLPARPAPLPPSSSQDQTDNVATEGQQNQNDNSDGAAAQNQVNGPAATRPAGAAGAPAAPPPPPAAALAPLSAEKPAGKSLNAAETITTSEQARSLVRRLLPGRVVAVEATDAGPATHLRVVIGGPPLTPLEKSQVVNALAERFDLDVRHVTVVSSP